MSMILGMGFQFYYMQQHLWSYFSPYSNSGDQQIMGLLMVSFKFVIVFNIS
jgi:hypothetical protein